MALPRHSLGGHHILLWVLAGIGALILVALLVSFGVPLLRNALP